jgi:VWFA-related protein
MRSPATFATPSAVHFRRTLALTVIAAAFAGQLLGQTPMPEQPSTTQSPNSSNTLRVEAREVVLDVVVTDHTGKVITNLPRSAFHVSEDKVDQRIVSFSRPEDHVLPPNAPPIKSSADLIKAGNVPINIIVLDELNTAFEDTSFGRSSVEKYLATQPAKLRQATTILAISDSGLKQVSDYTQDRDHLIDVLKRHIPVYPFRMMKGTDTGPDAGERLARCLGALLQISQTVKGYQGRKSILWVGKGFPSIDTDDVNADKAAEALNATQMVTSSLLESRTVLNIIDPTVLSVSQIDLSDPDMVSPNELLQAEGPGGQALFPGDINFADFAPATGGLEFFARNDVDKQIATAIDDGSEYYTVVYAPSDKTDDPKKFHQILVTLDDPSLVVWTRTGYYRAHHMQPGEALPKPDMHQIEFDLTNAGVGTMTYSGLILSADRDGDDKFKVSIASLGLDYRPGAKGTEIAEVTVMEVCFDAKNRPLEHHIEEKTTLVRDESAPMVFDIASPQPKGTVRVRLIARDILNGHLGTVDIVKEGAVLASADSMTKARGH